MILTPDSKALELQVLLANKQAEDLIRRWFLIRDDLNGDPEEPWFDMATVALFGPNPSEKAELERAKEYLDLVGRLERHETQPLCVRILPAR